MDGVTLASMCILMHYHDDRSVVRPDSSSCRYNGSFRLHYVVVDTFHIDVAGHCFNNAAVFTSYTTISTMVNQRSCLGSMS